MSNYDLKIVCLNFNLPTRGTRKPMNRDSFINNVHNNPEFREDLRRGKLYGLYTHAGRYYDNLNKNIPYSDNISSHPDLANVIVEEEIVGDEVHLSLQLLDGHHKRGTFIKELLKQGREMGVSMSTHCDPLKTDAYYITKLLGVDFTTDPAFIGTGIIEQNFSYLEVSSSILGGTGHPEIVNFNLGTTKIIDSRIPSDNIWHIPFSIQGFKAINTVQDYFGTITRFDNYLFNKKTLEFHDVPPEALDMETKANPQHFALLNQMILEAKYPPYRRLNRRIEELIREVKGKPEEFIAQNKDIYFQFINDPIYNWISKAFNSDKRMMLSIGLRLNKYVKNPSVVANADRKLEQIRKKRQAMQGVFDKTSQKQLDDVLKNLFAEIWKFIEERSNTVLLSKEGLKAVLQNYDASKTDYKTVEEWLDAGSDGVKDYNIWIKSYPYQAKDKDEYQNGYYGYEEVDGLIRALANNSLDDKGKAKLAKIMEDQNINNFSNLPAHMQYAKNFDETIEENDNIARRSITDADSESVADKILNDPKLLDKFVEKLQERGVVPPSPEQQEEGMPPVDAPPPSQPGEQPPVEGQQPIEGQPPMGEGQQPPMEGEMPPPQGDLPPETQPPAGQQATNNRFPKPKVITSQEASKLTGVNFSKVITIAKPLTKEQSRRLISFSVVEMLDTNISEEDLNVAYFSLGRPNGLPKETMTDLLAAKQYFNNGSLSSQEYQSVKDYLLSTIL